MTHDAVLPLAIGRTRLAINLAALPGARRDAIHARYAAFVTQPAATGAPIAVQVQLRAGRPFLPWDARTPLPLVTRRIGPRLVFVAPQEAGWLDPATHQARLILRPSGSVENFLRVVTAWSALAQGGLLLHACGIVRSERAFVFFGASGVGKSTVAGLSRAWTVLSDDLVLVERNATGYVAGGVPFRGSAWDAPRANTQAPLAGLYALRQAPIHALCPLAQPEATARLAAAAPFVTHCATSAATVLATCAALGAHVPVAELSFRKDMGFWEVIDGR